MYSLFIFFFSQWIAWYQALRARESSTLPTRSTERTSTREWKKKRWKREAKKKQKIVAYSGVKFKATAKAKRFLFFAKGPREKESRYEIQRIPPFSVLMAIRKTHKIESIRTQELRIIFGLNCVDGDQFRWRRATCHLRSYFVLLHFSGTLFFFFKFFFASLYRFAVTMQLQLLTRPIVEQLWKGFHLHLQCRVPFTSQL